MSMERYLGDVGDIIGEIAIWRIGFWRVLVEIPSILPRPRARRRQYPGSWRANEHSDRGSGELSGDDLAKFHGLILPRSRGFRDKQPPKRSWATSSVMVRLLDEGEIITSTRPGEVAFYEAAFPAGLRFPIHPTIRYSISLSEFRNLFSLNSNPKPDQGWLYFKARNKKVLLGGYPSNVKGWKSKFFFASGDEWGIPEGTSRKGAPRVPRTWGIPGWSLFSFHSIFIFIMLGWANIVYYSFQISTAIILLGYMATKRKSLKRFSGRSRSQDASPYPCYWNPNHFAESLSLPVLGRQGRRGDNLPSGEAPSSSSDVGESQNPHEQARRESPSRDDSIECLGSFRTELRRLIPHIPDLTLLRWTGEKVLDPILDHYLNVPSSNPSSESCSNSSLPVELESDGIAPFFFLGDDYSFYLIRVCCFAAMSKRVSFKKIGKKLGKTAGASSGTSTPAKGVVIGEKRARESIMSSPSKKGKADDGSKGKGVESRSEGKKKATSSSKVSATPPAAPSRPGEGTSAHLGTVPSPSPSILGSPSVAKRLLRRVIPQADKEKVEKLTLDQTATKLFHVIGQALDELAKAKGDRDSLADRLGKSGALVNELREALNKAMESAMEEFKSSSDFMVAVEDAASKYFGEGFDFARCNFGGIIPTSLSISRAPWSIKIC
ncbi:hypothetical protein Acr_09g0003970 [Actinidia rufa]|uniref:Uncharacterized protein n=1 Tax=Actinidia rufa TaxID=165716 RepID=A0A7J0F5N8_9ERIC|nr:hypothetical protein Acr_09g0003970 [Actinidia rufa]